MKPWQTRSRHTILNHSKWLTVENHTVGLPDGRVIEDWPWVITPDYVNVLAVTIDNQFVCFRQTKYAVAGTTLAPVAGYIEAGEDPLAAAQRELLEEAGYVANEWIDLGKYAVDGNRGAGTAYCYLATAAWRTAALPSDDLEEHEQLLLSRAELETAVLNHEFKLASWAALAALVLIRLKA
jgi:ADP-ribose pyrophosphatase